MVATTLLRFGACAVVLAVGLGAGAADAQAALHADLRSAPQAQRLDEGYVLGPSDVVEVQVLGQADFTTRAPLASDGSIALPYIGRVSAANKSASQLSTDVAQALEAGGYYSHPVVTVQIVGYASRYVTVLGNVVTPGLVPIDRNYHLSEILARVGGIKETAADYIILRSPGGTEHRFLISELATGGDAQDPLVAPGDKIFSPPAQTFYVSGQVRTPGQYPVNDGMTLRMAISRGGGLTDLGTMRGVKVTHPDGQVERPPLDAKVRPGDVIDVGERLF